MEPPDALGLVTLMDRVKVSAKKKQKEADDRYRQRHEGGLSIPNREEEGIAAAPPPRPTLESRNNPRRKFQEYFQSKQQAAVMLDEYLANHDRYKDEQVNLIVLNDY